MHISVAHAVGLFSIWITAPLERIVRDIHTALGIVLRCFKVHMASATPHSSTTMQPHCAGVSP
jgi:hypothetical protein